MISRCDQHGRQPLVRVSPDLLTSRPTFPIIDVLFEYEGQLALAFYLSREFAELRGIESGTFPLPDDAIDWTRELDFVCRRCFEDSNDGHIDRETFRWIPR